MNDLRFIASAAAPSAPGGLVRFAELVHNANRWYRVPEEIKKVHENPYLYLGGTVTNWVTGKIGIPMAELAILALYGRVILECIEKYNDYFNTYRQLRCVLEGRRIIVVDVPKTSNVWYSPYRIVHLLDPSLEDYLRIQTAVLWIRVKKIAYHTLQVFIKALALSSSIITLSEIWHLKGLEKMHVKNSVFINLKIVFDKLSKQESELRNELVKNQEVIDKYLEEMLYSEHSVDKILKAGSWAETVQSVQERGLKVFCSSETASKEFCCSDLKDVPIVPVKANPLFGTLEEIEQFYKTQEIHG